MSETFTSEKKVSLLKGEFDGIRARIAEKLTARPTFLGELTSALRKSKKNVQNRISEIRNDLNANLSLVTMRKNDNVLYYIVASKDLDNATYLKFRGITYNRKSDGSFVG